MFEVQGVWEPAPPPTQTPPIAKQPPLVILIPLAKVEVAEEVETICPKKAKVPLEVAFPPKSVVVAIAKP